MQSFEMLPSGRSDFRDIRQNHCFYADKTGIIPHLHNHPFAIFIRPRRLGKTLLMSMLCSYYDVAEAEDFSSLFDDLYIGRHPTADRNAFQILYFDFSVPAAQLNSHTDPAEVFCSYCREVCLSFVHKYAGFYDSDYVKQAEKLEKYIQPKKAYWHLFFYLSSQAEIQGHRIFVLIDNYDSLAGQILLQSVARTEVSVQISPAAKLYRDFFQLLKANFRRVFITGVMPVQLTEFASSLQVADNISQDNCCQDATGFSEHELLQLCAFVTEQSALKDMSASELCAQLQDWYGHYCFGTDGTEQEQEQVCHSADAVACLSRALESGRLHSLAACFSETADFDRLYAALRQSPAQQQAALQVLEQLEQATDKAVAFNLSGNLRGFKSDYASAFCSMLFYGGALSLRPYFGHVVRGFIPNLKARQACCAVRLSLLLPQAEKTA